MITLSRTVANDPVFVQLVGELDAALQELYTSYEKNFALLNKMDDQVAVIIAYKESIPVACGAIRPMQESTAVELKRMYVVPQFRGQGISKLILAALEQWAREKGYRRVLLETGKNQPAAISLYKNNGYHLIDVFGGYRHVDEAICMEKIL